MFEVLLTGPGEVHPVGEPVPVRVRIRNLAEADALATGVLDGSESGVRYPSYRPVIRHGDTIVADRSPADDPLVAPLRTEDFRVLGPGEAFNPEGSGYLPLIAFATYAPPRPGSYRFTLTLSTESDQLEDWLGPLTRGPERAGLLDLIRRVPRVTVMSAPLDVRVG